MADVFVSYATDDRERVLPIIQAIERAGFSVWWDRRIGLGSSFDREIERELDAAGCVVVVWSARSVESDWVRNEAQEGLDRNVLIPLLTDDVRPPLAFRRAQAAKLSPKPTPDELDLMLEAIRSIIRRDGLEPDGKDGATLTGERSGSSSSEDRISDTQRSGTAAAASKSRLSRLLKGVLATIALGAAAGGVLWWSGADERTARSSGIAMLDQLIEASEWEAAYQHATQLERIIPDDPLLIERWPKFSWLTNIESNPADAQISRRPYRGSSESWQLLGTAPLEDLRLPFGFSVLRAELDDHEPVVQVAGGSLYLTETLTPDRYRNKTFLLAPEVMRLDAFGSLPAGTVRVPGWRQELSGKTHEFEDFFLQRHEVTNLEYKDFVAGGGYKRPELWNPIIENGLEVPWASAMECFVDQTNQPGPSTWFAGDYREGTENHPVNGISWYEAAAYARFRSQSLPSIHHWRRAYAMGAIAAMVPESNLETVSTVPVGTTGSISWAGNHDMAGNVREWLLNAAGEDRFILGGAFNDDPYRASDLDFTLPPMNRSEGNGLRLVALRDEPAAIEAAAAPVELEAARDVIADANVSDEAFEAYRANFDYERTALNAAVEPQGTDRLKQHEVITIAAAYPELQLPIHLYLPTNASPPFQVVVYWPGSIVQRLARYEDFKFQFDFLLKSGRAVAFPIYYSSFGRQLSSPGAKAPGTPTVRDAEIRSIKDLLRTVDYLETRPDIDARRIAFFGNSWGSRLGLIGTTVDPRFSAAVFYTLPLTREPSPVIDATSYLTRLTTPSLVISGEYDPVVLLNEIARPGFDLIGTKDKRLVTAPGGHFVPNDVLVTEALGWLDRHLGEPAK